MSFAIERDEATEAAGGLARASNEKEKRKRKVCLATGGIEPPAPSDTG